MRNGVIQNVSIGVWAQSNAVTSALSDITVSNLTLSLVPPPIASSNFAAIAFGVVQNSAVRNCTFNNCTYGIRDVVSPGGNLYTNITMTNVAYSLFILPAETTPTVLERCEFGPPQSN